MQAQAVGARHSSRPKLAAASWSLVLGVLLAAAAVIDNVDASSFVVSIRQGRSIDKVAARYRSRGFVIQQQNIKHRFIVVATKADAAAPPPAVSPPPEPEQAAASHPGSTGSRSAAPPQQDGSTLSPGGEEPWLGTAVTAQGLGPTLVPPIFNRKAWGLQQDDSSSVGIASAPDTQTLQAIGGSDVAHIDINRRVYLVGTRPLPAAQRRRLLRQQQRQLQAAVQQAGSCPASNVPDKGLQFANVSEVVPYGIEMVEATAPEMIEISKQYRSKVLFCVIDSGFDPTNSEFRVDSSSGCVSGGTRPNGTPYRCRNSFNLTATTSVGRHGSHVSGTVVAARNGRGVVGVSAEGGLLYHFNAFGLNGTFDYVEVIDAWDDCIAELDYQKVATATPDMKMVVSMSFSTDGDVAVVANYLTNAAAQRPDILFLAAAGNDNDSKPNYPAMSPEVVSVAAVDWTGNKASFSNFGPTVEWAAPGVNTLSTLPMTSSSAYYTDTSVALTPFSPPADSPDILTNPRLTLMGGSGLGSVTAQMVDCGSGNSTCVNATGKICLLERGGNLLFCTKVTNCLAGGGMAALVYGRVDQPVCEQFTSVTLVAAQCATPAAGWPVVLAAARQQGLYLKSVIASQPGVNVTLNSGGGDYSIGLMSGTSMATPTAAGVAGLVWSAHADCTASQLRNAISQSAQDRGTTGRDDQFGFGIVKALQAHKYLLANPCNASVNSTDCVGNWTAWSPCQDGVQFSTFIVSTPAVGSGKACEAPENFVRNRTCSVGVMALPDSLTVESGVWTSVDAIVANDQGAIADIKFTAMRTAKNGVLRMLPLPEKGTQKTALPKNVVLQYLSAPGFVGNDTFGYIVSDGLGSNSTANVTVTVSPYGCRKSSCVAGGTCTGTGCTCAPGTGIFKIWITNTDRTDRQIVPRLPACRFRVFAPAPPLMLSGNAATAGTLVALDYGVTPAGVTPRCFARSKSPVSNVTFEAQADAAKCAGITGSLTEIPGTAKGALGCTAGVYRYVTQVPSTPGCYVMRVIRTDTQTTTINLLVNGKRRQ